MKTLEYPEDSGFLLSLPVKNFTSDHITSLEQKIEGLVKKLAELEKTTPSQIWSSELDTLLTEFTRHSQST